MENEKMDQRQHIDNLIKKSNEQSKKREIAQALYEEYSADPSESNFAKLIEALDDINLRSVRKKLRDSDLYTKDNEDTILQEAHASIFKVVHDQSRIKGVENFIAYVSGIYRKKITDVIRAEIEERKKYPRTQTEIQDDEGNSTNFLDTIPSQDDDIIERQLRQKTYAAVFRHYCYALLNAKAFPPSSLALFYARILPHLICEIPDTKAASAKWAFERMKNLTIWILTRDSQRIFQKKVDNAFKWGKYYQEQLDAEQDIRGYKVKLRDVIYTSVYDKDKIEDWSEYMHKAVVKAASNNIYNDKKLLGLVVDYASTDRVLQYFLKTRRKSKNGTFVR